METVFNQSIWGDEGFSAILSMHSLPDIIKIIARDTSPPLWNIWEWFVFRNFGTDEIYIRSLAFAFFVGTVFFVYKIGSLIWSRKTGFLAALLTFLNPFFFIYAFEGRMYSIMSMGVAGSMYFYLKFLREEELGKFTKIGYVFFSLWALYSHHFAIFIFFLQGLWWLYELAFGRRKRAKKMFKMFIFIGLGYVPWLYPLYTQTKMVSGGFWLGTPTTTDLRNLIYEYLAQGIKAHPYVLPIINLELHGAALYVVFALLIVRKWSSSVKSTLFLSLWFLLPILTTWFVSQHFQSVFYNRYLLYTIPGAMLVLASARRSPHSIILIAALAIIFANMDYYYYTHPTKPPFRQMAAYVKETKNEADLLVNWNSNGTHHIWETKYYDIPAPIYVPQGGGDLPFFVGTALMTNEDIIRDIPENIDRVGVVTSGPVEEVEIEGYEQESVKDLQGLRFIWYSKVSTNSSE